MQNNLIIKWLDTPADQGVFKWFIRGITSEGAFYGEILKLNNGECWSKMVKGQISLDDTARLYELANQIHELGGDTYEEDTNVRGLLALGPISSPHVVLKYHKGDEQRLHAAQVFQELIGIVKPYMRHFYCAEF